MEPQYRCPSDTHPQPIVCQSQLSIMTLFFIASNNWLTPKLPDNEHLKNLFVVYLEFLVFALDPFTNMEEAGFINYTAASHTGESKHFGKLSWSSPL